MFRGKITVSQGFFHAICYLLGGVLQLHALQLSNNRFGLFAGSFLTLLCMDLLQHFGCQLHLGTGDNRKYIAVEMNRAALVFGLGKHFYYSLQHTQTFVANNEFYTILASAMQPLEKSDPAGLILLHALCCAQNLTISILIYHNCHQNSNVFVFTAPVATQINTVNIDVRILTTL